MHHHLFALATILFSSAVALAGAEDPAPEPTMKLVAPRDAKLATVVLACPDHTKQVRMDDATYCVKVPIARGGTPIKHGPCVRFHAGGAMASQGSYVDDRREGVWAAWDEQGHRASLVTYAAGEYDGLYVTWWATGARQSEIMWKAGKKHGTAKSWGDDGKLLVITRYEQDRAVQKTVYGPDGKPRP
ncbi:MAG TPA: hypothetical protein VFT22_04345 [Kofleriaceae bacterium]|nr:hypothetical protein [Kofleriaceae bacterium]